MDNLKASLARLSRIQADWKATWPGQSFDDQQATEPLRLVAEAIHLKSKGLRPPPPPDLRAMEMALQAWHRAAPSLQELSTIQIRLLCRSEKAALDPRFLLALASHPLLPRRRGWAESLLAIYLHHWRPGPVPEAVESALKEVLARFPASTPWLDSVRAGEWAVLGPKAPGSIAGRLTRLPAGLRDVLTEWGLSPQEALGRAVAETALQAWSGIFRRRQVNGQASAAVAELSVALRELFPVVPLGSAFYRAVEDLILSEWSYRSQEVRGIIANWALDHPELGDPRRNLGGWHPIPEARARMISWMARRDLTFFYDSIVSSGQDDQGRKAFWLRFVDSVYDFQLVLSEQDRDKLPPEVDRRGGFSEMEGKGSPSAFLLRFRGNQESDDFVCVEFSKSGNALFIYDFKFFEGTVASMRALSFRVVGEPRNLKTGAYRIRKTHQGDWQSDVLYWLTSRGIRPL